jgi:hypothetical protein
MGGRMSGESPREEKIEGLAVSTWAGDANHARGADDTVAPTDDGQRSRQQLIALWPAGQHESCNASEWAAAVLWQAVDSSGDVTANAALEPCRPTASTKTKAMSSRFTGKA